MKPDILCITCLLAWTVLSVGLEVKLRPSQSVFTREAGASIVFSCMLISSSVDDKGKVSLEWIDPHGNEIQQLNGRVYKEEVEYNEEKVVKLYITSIQATDAGEYRCKGTHLDDSSQTDEKSVTIELFEDIRMEAARTIVNPLINTDALLSCIALGKPKPEVSWRYKGRRVKIGDGRYVMTRDGLLIHNVTEADNGKYSCRGEVMETGSYDETFISVAVHVLPEITEELENREAMEGELVSLRCKGTGIPTPVFEFYKDGVQVVNDVMEERRTVYSERGELIFNSVKRRDTGYYSCRAVNEAGHADSQNVSLLVHVPATVEKFDNVTLIEGERLALTCQSSGNPAPTVVISRDGFNYSHYDQGVDTEVHITSEVDGGLVLSVDTVRMRDAGEYECYVENHSGHQSLTASVTVQYKPRFSDASNLLVYGWAGTRRNISCQSYGIPTPSLTWQRNGVKIESNDTFHIFEWTDENSTSSILQVTVRAEYISWVFGNDYLCEGSNTVSTERQVYELKQAVSPDKPLGMQVTEVLADSVTIEVEKPLDDGGIPIIGYKLYYAEQSDEEEINETRNEAVEGSVESLPSDHYVETFAGDTTHIKDLKPNTTYRLSVGAYNQIGSGPLLSLEVTTDIPGVPGEIYIKSPSHGTHHRYYDLSWEIQSSGGLPILEYQLNYTKVYHQTDIDDVVKPVLSDWILMSVTVERGTTTYRLSDLSPQSKYTIVMRARNKIGYGPITEQFTFYTLDVASSIEDDDEARTGPQVLRSSLGLGLIVGIVLLVLLPIFLVVDIWRYSLGKSSLVAVLCGRRSSAVEKDAEVKVGDMEKQDLVKQQNGFHHSDDICQKIPLNSEEDIKGETKQSDVIVAVDDNGESNEINGGLSSKPSIV